MFLGLADFALRAVVWQILSFSIIIKLLENKPLHTLIVLFSMKAQQSWTFPSNVSLTKKILTVVWNIMHYLLKL